VTQTRELGSGAFTLPNFPSCYCSEKSSIYRQGRRMQNSCMSILFLCRAGLLLVVGLTGSGCGVGEAAKSFTEPGLFLCPGIERKATLFESLVSFFILNIKRGSGGRTIRATNFALLKSVGRGWAERHTQATTTLTTVTRSTMTATNATVATRVMGCHLA
jgi:hypothetical protein